MLPAITEIVQVETPISVFRIIKEGCKLYPFCVGHGDVQLFIGHPGNGPPSVSTYPELKEVVTLPTAGILDRFMQVLKSSRFAQKEPAPNTRLRVKKGNLKFKVARHAYSYPRTRNAAS